MQYYFEHIQRVKSCLSQMFEHGFLHYRGMEKELQLFVDEAANLNLEKGSELLALLCAKMRLANANECSITQLVLTFCNTLTYYELLLRGLIIQSVIEGVKEGEKL